MLLLRDCHSVSEVLLLRRANTGFMDGYFGPPGGHIEAAELPLAAAVRECQEEAGVLVSKATPLCVMPYRSAQRSGFNFVFTANNWQGQAYLAEPGSADLLCWVPVDSLPHPHPPWLAQVLQMGAAGDWYCELRYD